MTENSPAIGSSNQAKVSKQIEQQQIPDDRENSLAIGSSNQAKVSKQTVLATDPG